MNRQFVLSVCLAAAMSAAVSAQTPTTSSTQQTTGQTTALPTFQPTFVNLSGFSNDYQVGPGDLLEIQVVGHTDLSQTLRVSNTGEISHPMAGLIPVANLTAFDVEAAIAARFKEKGLIQQSEILVLIREYQAKPIYVSGAVVNPGEFIMSQELTVADAVLLAGGLQFNAADEAYLHRRVSDGGQSWSPAAVAANPEAARPGMEVVKVDLLPLKEGRFYETALSLRRGDVLIVPQQQLNPFFVVGDVVTPRNYFYTPKQTLMASQAISWAGGPTATAKMSDGMLVRYDAQGNRTELKVDYDAILKGRQEDFRIEPNDIIFVPGSKVKTIGQGLLLLTDTMVMTTSFRVARTYQMPDAPELGTREPR